MSDIVVVPIPVWRSLAGGALIGVGSAILILFNGRIAGVSGILDRALHGVFGPETGASLSWRDSLFLV